MKVIEAKAEILRPALTQDSIDAIYRNIEIAGRTCYKSEDKMTLVELTEKCDNDKAAVSRAVGDMIEKGLILKENDSYRAGLYLTDEGIKAAEFVCERAKTAVEAAGVTEEEREAFYLSLEKLEKNLKTISKKGM